MLKLSDRARLTLCEMEGATEEKPRAEIMHRRRKLSWKTCAMLRDKGLLNFRCYDRERGSGGYWLTPLGRVHLNAIRYPGGNQGEGVRERPDTDEARRGYCDAAFDWSEK